MPGRYTGPVNQSASPLTERVVVIGAAGQLGSELMRAFSDVEPAGVDHAQVDIERPSAIAAMLARFRPTLALNTAAFHNVEHCQTLPERAFAVNALAVDDLAAQCENAGCALLHVSTDYVFDGTAREPYAEDAPTNPLSVYGISKVAGEQLVRCRTPRHFIVRTSGLFGVRTSTGKGYTFVDRMLAQARAGQPLRVVDDVTFSPTYAPHAAAAIRRIVEAAAFGTYHVTNAGSCTWYAFACEALRRAGLSPSIEAVASSTFGGFARRPAYSALGHGALARLGLPAMPDWREGIAAYLAERESISQRP